MKYLFLVFSFCLLLFMQACNSGSGPSTPAIQYYKGLDKVGSYWIYQVQDIDTSGNVLGTTRIDSVFVAGSKTVDGKQASIVVSEPIPNPSSKSDTTYFSIEGGRLYEYAALSPLAALSPNTSKQWVRIADTTSSSRWLASDTSNTKDTVVVGSQTTASINSKNWVDVSHGSDSTIVGSGTTTFKSKSFVADMRRDVMAQIVQINISAPVTIKGSNRKLYFSDGVGLVLSRTEPLTMSTVLVAGFYSYDYAQNGTLRKLMRYTIK